MRRTERTDTRVVYGMRCVWWDGIENVGKTPTDERGISIPCCPHCGGVLMELPSPADWWRGVEAHEANGHPGYRAFIEWQKGKCFPTMRAAQIVYETKPGRAVKL